MTSTTTTSLTGAQIADGLDALAAIFRSTDTLMPELLFRTHPDIAVSVGIALDSPEHVAMVAARFGVKVEQHVSPRGRTLTHADIPMGEQHADRTLPFSFPVLLEVAHITDADGAA